MTSLGANLCGFTGVFSRAGSLWDVASCRVTKDNGDTLEVALRDGTTENIARRDFTPRYMRVVDAE